MKIVKIWARKSLKGFIYKWKRQTELKKEFLLSHEVIDSDIPLSMCNKVGLVVNHKANKSKENQNISYLYIKHIVEKLSCKYSDIMLKEFVNNIQQRPDYLDEMFNDEFMNLVNEIMNTLVKEA